MIYNSVSDLIFSNGLVTLFLLVLIIMALAAYVHVKYYVYDKRFMDLASRIPGPRWYPFIGTAYVFDRDVKENMKNIVQLTTVYPNVSRHWIGPLLYICIQDPKDIEKVLSNNSLIWKSDAYDFLKTNLGNGLLTGSGEEWKRHRKVLRPTFSFQILENYLSVFNDRYRILSEVLESEMDKGIIDAYPYLLNCINDVMFETLLSTERNEQVQLKGSTSYFAQCVVEASRICLSRMFKPWLYSDTMFALSSKGRLHDKYKSFFEKNVKEVIDRKRNERELEQKKAKNEEIGDKKVVGFLDYILDHFEEMNFSDEDLMTETSTIAATATDTTPVTIAMMLAVLSRRFDIQKKLVEEIDQVMGSLEDKPLTFEDLQNLTYLDRVLKETMRVYTIIPYIARKVTEEIDLQSGYKIPKGCSVLLPFFRLHRNPDCFPNPKVFDPDNFLQERISARSSYSYCPFSAGVRDCIGKKFAIYQVKISIVYIIRKFWIIPSDRKIFLESKLNLNPCDGIYVGFQKRTPARPKVPGMERMSKGLETNMEYLDVLFKNSY
uniref:Cytochrome P450 n=1 Tax=Clastoptera arizonana TaxID=38151 RepID=A0A1B6DZH4_9HEMI